MSHPWTYKRQPISHPHGSALGVYSECFGENWLMSLNADHTFWLCLQAFPCGHCWVCQEVSWLTVISTCVSCQPRGSGVWEVKIRGQLCGEYCLVWCFIDYLLIWYHFRVCSNIFVQTCTFRNVRGYYSEETNAPIIENPIGMPKSLRFPKIV